LKKKIFFVSYGVGGAEALNPVYLRLREEGLDVRNICVTDFSLTRLTDAVKIPEKEILDYLRREKPDIVVNERSNGVEVQNSVTRRCRELGILNIAVLDMYGNYANRFAEVPDIIAVPGRDIYDDLLDFGIPEAQLVITGNPGFDELEQHASRRRERDIDAMAFLYLSQPLFEKTADEDQLRILANCVEAFDGMGIVYELGVKLHPNEENPGRWSDMGYHIVSPGERNPLDFYEDYDLVFGYNSTPLLKTKILGIPTLFCDEIEKNGENLGDIMRHFVVTGRIAQQHRYLDFRRGAAGAVEAVVRQHLG
jgi:hypothetical protein